MNLRALSARSTAGVPNVAGTRGDEQVEARDGAPAGREHRVDQQHEAVADLLGQVRVVARGNRRRLVALEAEMPDPRGRRQVERGLEHAQPRAQHRNDHDIAGDRSALGRLEWRLDGPPLGRHIAQRFGQHDRADAPSRPAELDGRRLRVAQREQRVLGDGMRDEMNRHAETIHE
jgi:hypothetical protein